MRAGLQSSMGLTMLSHTREESSFANSLFKLPPYYGNNWYIYIYYIYIYNHCKVTQIPNMRFPSITNSRKEAFFLIKTETCQSKSLNKWLHSLSEQDILNLFFCVCYDPFAQSYIDTPDPADHDYFPRGTPHTSDQEWSTYANNTVCQIVKYRTYCHTPRGVMFFFIWSMLHAIYCASFSLIHECVCQAQESISHRPYLAIEYAKAFGSLRK